jgi:hypothetical protein
VVGERRQRRRHQHRRDRDRRNDDRAAGARHRVAAQQQVGDGVEAEERGGGRGVRLVAADEADLRQPGDRRTEEDDAQEVTLYGDDHQRQPGRAGERDRDAVATRRRPRVAACNFEAPAQESRDAGEVLVGGEPGGEERDEEHDGVDAAAADDDRHRHGEYRERQQRRLDQRDHAEDGHERQLARERRREQHRQHQEQRQQREARVVAAQREAGGGDRCGHRGHGVAAGGVRHPHDAPGEHEREQRADEHRRRVRPRVIAALQQAPRAVRRDDVGAELQAAREGVVRGGPERHVGLELPLVGNDREVERRAGEERDQRRRRPRRSRAHRRRS